jgi:hypothetical protein
VRFSLLLTSFVHLLLTQILFDLVLESGCHRHLALPWPGTRIGFRYLRILIGKVRFILTSVVGINSYSSDEIHLWIIISFSFCLPRLPQVPLVARPVK